MEVDTFRDFVLDQLRYVGDVRCRDMFGACGLYCGGTFFGIIHQGSVFFKTNDMTRAAYIQRGMYPYQPNERQTLVDYYEVPIEIINDPAKLTSWALEAIQIHDSDTIPKGEFSAGES